MFSASIVQQRQTVKPGLGEVCTPVILTPLPPEVVVRELGIQGLTWLHDKYKGYVTLSQKELRVKDDSLESV